MLSIRRLTPVCAALMAIAAPAAHATDTLTCHVASAFVDFRYGTAPAIASAGLQTGRYTLNGQCIAASATETNGTTSTPQPVTAFPFLGEGTWTNVALCGLNGRLDGYIYTGGMPGWPNFPGDEGNIKFDTTIAIAGGNGTIVASNATDGDGDSGGSGAGVISVSPTVGCLPWWNTVMTFTIKI
jgi:hypothetical protein